MGKIKLKKPSTLLEMNNPSHFFENVEFLTKFDSHVKNELHGKKLMHEEYTIHLN